MEGKICSLRRAITSWWEHLGRERYPDARTLTVTADCGGANGYRTRLWKVELQRLADETGLAIQVCHFPPGTSKWNKIEHRLFSFITINWRGKPLTELATIVNLIASTTTRSGLKVFARLDEGSYPAKVTVSDAKLEAIDLHGHAFHPEWNYTREPRGIPWRRLTLYVEAAATATACFPVANFVRHGGREVDGTPRSEVLGETSSATALGSGVDAEVQRIRGGWLGRRLCCRRVRRACDRSGAKKRTSYASLVAKPGARAGTACAREGQGNTLIRRRRMGGHNGRCRHRSSDEDHEDPEG